MGTGDEGGAAAADCPLSHREQTRNLLIYAANTGLLYLASPVGYVGVVQATLLTRLGFEKTQANLPTGVYLWTTPVAVLVAWYFPQVRLLRPLLAGSFLLGASLGALVAVATVLFDREVVLAAVVAHAAVWGCCNGVVSICQWEMVGRGVSEARRGQALALAFGARPVLAVVAAIASQLVLAGHVEGIDLPFSVPAVAYPWNFAALFAASAPALGLAALLSCLFVVPKPAAEPRRQPFVAGVFGGAGRYFGHRLILIAAIAYVLVYSGNTIQTNISLYTGVLLGRPAENYAGLLQALRFGFKVVAGFLLGWLLVKTNPKTLLLVTAVLTLASVVWAMTVPGMAFLFSFGILGAGELFGVYYPNYILGCSPKPQLRRNMALTNLITMPVGFPPVLYGFIAEVFGREDKKFGFEVSFAAAAAVLVAGILLVLFALPARPRPPEEVPA